MDYYASKSRDKPRFVYRNLIERLQAPDAPRAALIEEFTRLLADMTTRGDWLKLKWCMPAELAAVLDDREKAALEQAFTARRARRNDRLLDVFPHCSDEFSFDTAFLDAAFGSARLPLIGRDTAVSTIGSCFARNIARYLNEHGYQVKPYRQAEDLNSPFSNAKMLALCAAGADMKRAYVTHWVKAIYPAEMSPPYDKLIETEIGRLDELASFIRNSEVIIVTFGNVIDYFLPAGPVPGEPGPDVAPKFFLVGEQEDVELRLFVTQRLKQAGAEFRMGTATETLAAVQFQHQAIRQINPSAQLIYTLSPIPIDGAHTLNNPKKRGAIELDCISKSTLRVALAQFMDTLPAEDRVQYFPSFEIVRWIAPCLPEPVFGQEDAASRHVSQPVLNGIYRYFLEKFRKPA